MATATELKKQIKALEANLKNKSKYKPNVVEKLEEKLKTAKAELSKLTKSTTKKPSVLQKLKKMVNSKADLKIYKKPIDKSGRKTDLKKDGDVSALPMGKRITQNVGGNRVAGKSGKAKKGNVYYEYRANRVDVRQPSVKVKRPNKLEMGGELTSFEKQVKDALKQENKWHFINEMVDGQNVQLKMFPSKTSVDVQIFKIDGIHARMPKNYVGKRETLKMIMDNFTKMAYGGMIKTYHATIMSIDPNDQYGREQGDDKQKYGLSVQASNTKDAEIKAVEQFKRQHGNLPIYWVKVFADGGMMADGGMFEEPIAMYRPLSGKISAKATISYDVPKEEFDQFVNYVYDVYEEEGYNKSQVRVAVRKYLKDLEGEFTWGGGDSLDRERVYEYLKNPKQKGIVNPFLADGGMMADGGKVKNFNVMRNVGKSKYVINSYDGVKKHKDGSAFYDIHIFKNLKDFMEYKKKLKSEGYQEMADGGMMAKGGKTLFDILYSKKKPNTINYAGMKKNIAEGKLKTNQLDNTLNALTGIYDTAFDVLDVSENDVITNPNKQKQFGEFMKDNDADDIMTLLAERPKYDTIIDGFFNMLDGMGYGVLNNYFALRGYYGSDTYNEYKNYYNENPKMYLNPSIIKPEMISYEDGMMAKGGMTDNTFDNILMDYGFKKTKTFSGKRFFSGGKNKEIFASVDDKLKEVRVETNDVTIYSGYSITDLMYILKRNKNLFLADGGMMAQGGRLNVVKKYNTISDYLKDAKSGDLVLIGRDENDLKWIGDSHLNRFVKIDEEGEGIFQIFGRKGLVSFPSNKNVIVVDRKYEDGGMFQEKNIMEMGGKVQYKSHRLNK